MRALLPDLAVILIAAVLVLLHPTAAWVAGPYARAFYAPLQRTVTSATNLTSFALGDLLIVAVAVALVTLWVRGLRRSRTWKSAARLVVRSLALVAVLYVWFLVAWGWNYLRDPLYRSLGYDGASVQRFPLERLEGAMVEALNAAAPDAHRANASGVDPTASLRNAYESALPLLGVNGRVTETDPKRTLLDPYFTATGISGMFFPFTFETYLASDIFWFEYPFNLAHEWGHLAGIARESDANFVGALTTLRDPDPILHYSGLLVVYGAMPRNKTYDARLSKLVLADYAAMRQRDERHVKPLAFKFAWTTYDKYLKSQHVETGVVNYTEYVQLLLGTPAGRDALARGIKRRL